MARARPISNPPNPYASTERAYLDEVPQAALEVYEDATASILASNDSPDVGFRYSVNPYRGCQHACAYCYARPSHEYLSFGAGTDFDSKILVKRQAARLLRVAFEKPSWRGEPVVFSGVTDCYQPLEASLRLTRACLEVCLEYGNPVGLITKAPLVERDLDVLQALHLKASVHVAVSVPIWDQEVARALEPGVATPRRRVQTIAALARAGIPVSVLVAPFIPAVSEEGLLDVLQAAKDAGASGAGYVLLRLPGSVKAVFEERVRQALPLRAEKILHRLSEMRGGKLYDARFGVRGRGEGPGARAIEALFESTARKVGLNAEPVAPPPDTFRRPVRPQAQLALW